MFHYGRIIDSQKLYRGTLFNQIFQLVFVALTYFGVARVNFRVKYKLRIRTIFVSFCILEKIFLISIIERIHKSFQDVLKNVLKQFFYMGISFIYKPYII